MIKGRAGQLVVTVSMITVSPFGREEVFTLTGMLPFFCAPVSPGRVPVTPGEHTIRVIARNAEQPSSRWYSGAGIYRPVTLVCLPEKHILPESIVIETLDIRSGHVRVSFRTTGMGEAKVEILDGSRPLCAFAR